MKKTIIAIFIIILFIIAYFMIFDNFKIGEFSIKSIQDIKALDESLTEEINAANKKKNQEYLSEVSNLRNSIDEMKIAKEKYEKYNMNGELEAVQIKTYKIEYLWATIGQYAKKNNIQLTLDVANAGEKNLYNLNFKLIGDYIDIIDCMEAIEEDDSFEFKITDFELLPYTKNYVKKEIEYSETDEVALSQDGKTLTTTINAYDGITTIEEKNDETKATAYDPNRLIATFVVKNVGIQFN